MQKGKLFSLYKRPTNRGEAEKKRAGRRWSGIYYCQFKLPDGSFGPAKSTGKADPREAEAWAIEYLRRGRVVLHEGITVRDFSEGFFDWPDGEYAIDRRAARKRISERACIEKAAKLKTHVWPALGSVRLTAIDKAAVKAFRNDMFREGLGSDTINKTLLCLRAILRAGEDRGLLQAVPTFEFAGNADRHHRGVLTPEETAKVFAVRWPDIRCYTASFLAAGTGMRLSEILGLQRRYVHPDYVEVAGAWEQRLYRYKPETKSGQPRVVPLPSRVSGALQELMNLGRCPEPDGFVFFSWHRCDRPMEGKEVIRGFYRALEAVGISGAQRVERRVSFHSWRHAYNSLLVNRGISKFKVQTLVGHQDDVMTANYFHPDEYADVRQVTNGFFDALPAPTAAPVAPATVVPVLERRPSKATQDRLVIESPDYLVSVGRLEVEQLADDALDHRIRAALAGDPSMAKTLGLRRLRR